MSSAVTATTTTSLLATWRNYATSCAGLDLVKFLATYPSKLFSLERHLKCLYFCCFLVGSYVWEHLEMGYVQGMCDLLAPLMVILDDGK